jgi:hypothetical protein
MIWHLIGGPLDGETLTMDDPNGLIEMNGMAYMPGETVVIDGRKVTQMNWAPLPT